jgi:outer membrane protein assembly factor BamB
MIPGLTPRAEISLSAETWSTPLWLEPQGLIVAATRDGRISAWRSNGVRAWSQQVGDVLTASPNFAVLGARAYILIGAHDGWLSALDASDGRIVWRRNLGGVIRATVSVAGLPVQGRDAHPCKPQVFAASYGDHLWRLEAETGEVHWRKWLPPHVWARGRGVVSSPIVADVDGDGQLEIVVGSRSWRLFCVTAHTGKLCWWRGFDYGIDSTCTLTEIDGAPALLVGTGESLDGPGDCAVVALAGGDGALRWRTRVGGGVDSSATCFWAQGHSYLVQTSLADASCHCLDSATGRIAWTYRMGPSAACNHGADNVCIANGRQSYFTDRACCRSYTTPLVIDVDADGRLEVLVGSMNGHVYSLDAAAGSEKGRWDTSSPVRGSPILANLDGDGSNQLIVPSGQRLLLFNTRAVGCRWPLFKGDPSLSGARWDAEAASDPHALPEPRVPRPAVLRRPVRIPHVLRRALAAESRLFLAWTVRDLGYFVRTRVDKHILGRMGRRYMTYWY